MRVADRGDESAADITAGIAADIAADGDDGVDRRTRSADADAHAAADGDDRMPSADGDDRMPSADGADLVPSAHGDDRVTSAESVRDVQAFMDIGTNSIRLVIVRFLPGDTHKVLNQQKEVVRLGEDEFIDHYLQSGAMRRAALVCRKFVEMASAYGAEDVLAIATSATREARNQKEFLRLLRDEAGLQVHTISGREEARLIYLGVSSGIHLGPRPALFLDIGGGSTEVIVGDQHAYHYLDSMKLGAIRLTSMFFMPDEAGPVADDRYALVQRYVRNASIRTAQRLEGHPFELAVGGSGTIENLADIAVRRFRGRERTRDDVMTYPELHEVMAELRRLPLDERRRVPGINAARADIIVAGGAILETLMDDLGIESLRISDRGLREGLIVDYLARRNPELFSEMTVRERSVLRLGRACGFDEGHARIVAGLAVQLFDAGRDIGLHAFGDTERELLHHAAMLHDIGALLSYSDHHMHTHYLIRNADLLGFDQTEISRMAAIARFHRKGFPRKRRPVYAELDKTSRRVVRPLSIFLRVAESLDRSHAGLVRLATLRELDDQRVALEIECGNECQLEVWGAETQKKVFAKAFKRELVVRTV